MWDVISTSGITLIGLAIAAFVGGWVAFEFYRSHRSYKARERLYLSIHERIQRGEAVSPDEYEEFLPEDQASLNALQRSKKTKGHGNGKSFGCLKAPVLF